MTLKTILVIGLAILFFAGTSNALTTHAYDAYDNACKECTFDANGRMDRTCQAKHQAASIAGLTAAYPITNTKYLFGQCPQVDECTKRLESCKAAVGTGSELEDCIMNPAIAQCFRTADACMHAANEVCANGKTEEEAGMNDTSAGGKGTQNNATPPLLAPQPPRMPREPNPILEFLDCRPMTIMLSLLVLGSLFLRRE